MPRSKNDPHKRKCAQALNHTAAAILDINDVYNAFDKQYKKLVEVAVTTSEEIENAERNQAEEKLVAELRDLYKSQAANIERYKAYTKTLETIMIGVNACREHLLMFTKEVWNLDEDSIRVYLG